MATHDYIISNASGAAVRADLNNALAAIVSNNSNATSPATTYAFQFWADTTTGQLKIRNAANSAWITLMELDGTMLMEDGSASAPGLAFANDTNTGIFSPAGDQIGFATGGAERFRIETSECIFNEPSNDVDFRVESNNNSHMLFVDAGNDRVGIGASSPATILHTSGSSDQTVTIQTTTSGADTRINFRNSSGTDAGGIHYKHNGNHLTFHTGGSLAEMIRIDGNGRLLVAANSSTANSGADDLQIGARTDSGERGITVASSAAGSIRFADDGNDTAGYIFYSHSDNSLRFGSDGSEALRIDSSGRLLLGTSSSVAPNRAFQIAGSANMSICSNVNSADGVTVDYIKSRNTSYGSNTIVQDGDTIAKIQFRGDDGSDYLTQAAQIAAQVDGTPGSNDMPGRLTFSTTADGASSPTERVRIDSSGRVGIGTTGPGAKLQVVENSTNNTPLSHNYPATQSGIVVDNQQTGTTGAFTAVSLRAYNSSSTLQAASIIAQSTGSGFSPSLLFTQRSGSGTNAEIMRLDSSGRLLVGTSAASSSGIGKLVTRNDVNYTSTEFEDNATLVVQNETNNNSAVIVFHSNDASGSSGRAAIVGGTVANGKGKLGFYGSCMNKDSSDGEDVTIDADGRLLVGTSSAPNGIHQDANSTFETYKASGQNHLRVQSDDLGNGAYSLIRAQGNTSGGGTRQAWIGVYKHSGIVNPGPFLFLEAEDGQNLHYWSDNANRFRISTNVNDVGTTNGSVVGTQVASDLRLKNVGASVSYGLAEVKQLQPKQYALKKEPDVNRLGFIAQEVESIIPEAVFDTNEELEGHQEGDRTKLGMEYIQLIPVLVNAIKELSAEVDTLKTKVAALEAG